MERLSVKECRGFLEFFRPKILKEGFMRPLMEFSGKGRSKICLAVKSLSRGLLGGNSFQHSIRNMLPGFPLPVEELMVIAFEKSVIDLVLSDMIEIYKLMITEDELLDEMSLLVDKYSRHSAGGELTESCIERELLKIWKRAELEDAYDVFLEQEGERFFHQKYIGVKMIHVIEPCHSMVYNSLLDYIRKVLKGDALIVLGEDRFFLTRNGRKKYVISGKNKELFLSFY